MIYIPYIYIVDCLYIYVDLNLVVCRTKYMNKLMNLNMFFSQLKIYKTHTIYMRAAVVGVIILCIYI